MGCVTSFLILAHVLSPLSGVLCAKRIKLKVLFGLLVYLLASLSPPIAPIGIYNTVLIASIPTIYFIGFKRLRVLDYSLGMFFGAILFVLISFQSWQALAPLITFIQVVPFVCIVLIATFVKLFTLSKRQKGKHLGT